MTRSVSVPVFRVKNTVTFIEAPRDIVHEIDKRTAVAIKGAQFAQMHRPNWDGMWHPVNVLQKTFPTGLLPRVRRVVPVAKVIDERVKPPQRPLDPDCLRGIVLRDYQLAGVIGILEHVRGVVGIGTGAGKTEIGIAVGVHVPGKCVFFVHRRDLLHQTHERIEERTGQRAALLGDGMWDDRAGEDDTKFVIAMHQTIALDVNRFRDQVSDATSMILDEVHRTGAAATWYRFAQLCPAYYRCGLTGTPETGDPVKDMRLEAAAGPILIRMRAADLAKQGILAPCKVRIHRVDNQPVPSKDWAFVRRVLIEENDHRNDMIFDIINAEARAGRRVLVICDTKRHQRRLGDALRGTNLRIAVLHGGHATAARSAAKRDLRSGVLEVVLATPIWDDSIDLPELDTVVLAAGGRSGVRVLQRIGRALRRVPGKDAAIIHDFDDLGHRYVVKHSAERQRACKREGFEVTRV